MVNSPLLFYPVLSAGRLLWLSSTLPQAPLLLVLFEFTSIYTLQRIQSKEENKKIKSLRIFLSYCTIRYEMHIIQEGLMGLSKENDVLAMKLSDLARLLNVEHLQQIKYHRQQLVDRGLLKPAHASKEVIEEAHANSNTRLFRIPVLGSANAGPATIYADGKVTGYLRLSEALLPKGVARNTLYALKVVGRSMNRAKIGPNKLPAEDGDYILADGSSYQPNSGDYVVSLIGGNANLKRLAIGDGQIALLSESTDDFPPIVISGEDDVDYLAQSKIVQVVKTPRI